MRRERSQRHVPVKELRPKQLSQADEDEALTIAVGLLNSDDMNDIEEEYDKKDYYS